MRYSTIVEHDEKTLTEISSALEQFEEERFVAGIQARKYTLYDIEQAIDMVQAYQSRMNIEARALVRFSETFIQQFATDNNHCFETAEMLFNRIRSTLSALKKVFHQTCERSNKALPAGAALPSVFERSTLSYAPCTPDLFGLESYDEHVRVLYKQFETLLTTATTTLGLCHSMIESEAMTRNDSEQLKSIYHTSCEQLMGSVREFSELMNQQQQQLPETELNRRRARARSMDDFLKAEYHNVPKKEFKLYVWLEAMKQGTDNGLTEEEIFLFHDTRERVPEVRRAIACFDDMDVEGQQGKLDSTSIVYFLKWCGVDAAKEKRLYQYFCTSYRGRFRPIGWSAVAKERKELRELAHVDDGMAAMKFQQMLDALPGEKSV